MKLRTYLCSKNSAYAPVDYYMYLSCLDLAIREARSPPLQYSMMIYSVDSDLSMILSW